jgi:hypothetical protein
MEIEKQILSLMEHYNGLLLSLALDNDNSDFDILPETSSSLSLKIHQEQLTFTIQSLFKLIRELRALRALRSSEESP